MRGLNFVCLDAPLVATAWQSCMADAFAMQVSLAARVSLFLTVWGIYLTDRFADAASVRSESRLSARQRFCRRHRKIWLASLLVVLVGDAAISIFWLDRAVWTIGLVVGLLCLAYLAVNRVADRIWTVLPMKEVFIGVLFALGTVAALLPTTAIHRSEFAVSVTLFALLCASNCVAIAVWERPVDLAQGKHSLGTRWPNLEAHVLSAMVGFVALCLVGVFASRVPRGLGALLAGSALGLGLLHACRRRIATDSLTALADLVLMFAWVPALLHTLR